MKTIQNREILSIPIRIPFGTRNLIFQSQLNYAQIVRLEFHGKPTYVSTAVKFKLEFQYQKKDIAELVMPELL
jgi:hypothetical protein